MLLAVSSLPSKGGLRVAKLGLVLLGSGFEKLRAFSELESANQSSMSELVSQLNLVFW